MKIIYLIFFLSGGTALIYEVIWTKELTLIMGNTIYSSATVLAAFMGGLALGSILLGRYIDRSTISPLKLYALLELLIGLFAIALPSLLAIFNPLYSTIYQSSGFHPYLLTLLKFTISFCFLLIPTFLMGGTLPILSTYIVSSFHHLGRRIGTLYAVNTLGAVVGSLLAGYVLIGWIGVKATTYLAVLINVFLFLFAYLLSISPIPALAMEKKMDNQNVLPNEFSEEQSNMSITLVLFIYALSGFTALAYEIIWMRVFIPFLSSSIYSFTTMLVAFLLGLSLGSLLCSRLVDRINKIIPSLGMVQILIGFSSLLSLLFFNLFYSLFSNQLNLALENMNAWAFIITIGFYFFILLPPSLLMGAVFPMVIKICSNRKIRLLGTTVGNIYFLNTIGAILGSLITGFFLIHWLGVQGSFMLIVAFNILGGTVLIATNLKAKGGMRLALASSLVAILTLSSAGYSKNIFQKVFIDRLIHLNMLNKHSTFMYYREDTAATICALESSKGAKNLLINSIPTTGIVMETKLMAHLPLLLHNKPKNGLVICFGMGTTFRSAYLHGIDVTAVELVPNLLECFPLFHDDAQTILDDPKTKLIVNDGRNHLLLSEEVYDIITVDPSPPLYSSGTVNLYTQEFYNLCHQRLTDDGICCMWLWVPSCRESEFKMLVKTFMSAFPHTTVWSGVYRFGIYLIGSKQKLSMDLPSLARKIGNPCIQDDLKQSIKHPVDIDEQFIANLFLFDEETAWDFVKDATILTDDHPYTEYPLLTWWKDKKKIDISTIVDRRSDVKKLIKESP
ncbi:MAG: fused MFS/spermidine synthase [Candidatus Thermoplasmatota archaeon]|nr:fused MFS/spermidine synthase [Candidatus Thermoplasmatota archaeon]